MWTVGYCVISSLCVACKARRNKRIGRSAPGNEVSGRFVTVSRTQVNLAHLPTSRGGFPEKTTSTDTYIPCNYSTERKNLCTQIDI